MKEIKAIIQPFMLEKVLRALSDEDLPGVTVSQVLGWGRSRAEGGGEIAREGGHDFVKKTKLEIVVSDEMAGEIEKTIAEAAHTGHPGDGKIFVIEVARVRKIRSGAMGSDAV